MLLLNDISHLLTGHLRQFLSVSKYMCNRHKNKREDFNSICLNDVFWQKLQAAKAIWQWHWFDRTVIFKYGERCLWNFNCWNIVNSSWLFNSSLEHMKPKVKKKNIGNIWSRKWKRKTPFQDPQWNVFMPTPTQPYCILKIKKIRQILLKAILKYWYMR